MRAAGPAKTLFTSPRWDCRFWALTWPKRHWRWPDRKPPTVGSRLSSLRLTPLDMPDLEHDLFAPSQFDELIGLGHGRADRLLDEQMRSCFEQIDGQAMVQHCGRGDHCRVDPAQQSNVRGKRACVQLGGQSIVVGSQRIDNAHEFHVGDAGQLLRMEAAQAAGTDDSNA